MDGQTGMNSPWIMLRKVRWVACCLRRAIAPSDSLCRVLAYSVFKVQKPRINSQKKVNSAAPKSAGKHPALCRNWQDYRSSAHFIRAYKTIGRKPRKKIMLQGFGCPRNYVTRFRQGWKLCNIVSLWIGRARTDSRGEFGCIGVGNT